MNIARIVAAIAAASIVAGVAPAAPPADFARRVEAARSGIGVPGVAIAIVENDQVTFAKGFGVRALGAGERVDADTIFPTGSTGKAFTVADLAILVDAGKIGWDDRVTDRLPGFEMYDPWVTREITIRDLLVHRSGLGLGEGDLMFVPRSNLTRAEAVHRLRYLKPASSFRYGFAYDNVLYMVAGQLIEAVSGETWERFTTEHVLKAAGMRNSTADEPERFANANRAYPHARMDGGLRGAGTQERLNEREELGRAAAPAGGLTVSANDMARWLMIQLDHGELPGHSGRLFSEGAQKQMWKPMVLQPVPQAPEPLKATQPNFNTYALGWDVTDYAGTKIVWHGGAVLGFLTAVVLIPEKRVGYSIEINSEDGELIRGLMFELLDHYLGRPHVDWVARFAAEKQRRINEALAALKTAAAKPAQAGPSLPLAAYAGTYHDPWYGNIEVAAKDGRLTIDFKTTPRMSGTLEHYQYDTFTTNLEDKTIEPAYVTFSLDAEGKVDRVTMKAVSPIADFSYDYHDLLFTPVKEPRP
ncbi:MAG TPA: serine hydrolase [Steroidobacteraceae bacterium]|nr:serine hydrolase [Steroidobacteraceae bacterium]